MSKKIKPRKRGSPSEKQDKGFLSNLIPDKLELTIRVPEEDKQIIIDKIDETKNEMIFNWRIVQIIMATGLILSAIDKMFL